MFEAVNFTGEFGGLLALAFAMGAGAGWGFAQRTTLKVANERIDELKQELSEFRHRVTELEDQRFHIAREKK